MTVAKNYSNGLARGRREEDCEPTPFGIPKVKGYGWTYDCREGDGANKFANPLPLQPLRPRVVAGQPLEPTGPGEPFPRYPSISAFFRKRRRSAGAIGQPSPSMESASWVILRADGRDSSVTQGRVVNVVLTMSGLSDRVFMMRL